MKRTNSDMFFSLIRQRSKRLLILFGISCIFLGIFQVSFVLKDGIISVPREGSLSNSKGFQKPKRFAWQILEEKHAQIRPLDFPFRSRPKRKIKELAKTHLSGLNFTAGIMKSQLGIGFFKSANDAVELGRKLWQELELNEKNSSNRGISSASSTNSNGTNKDEECPYSMSVSGDEFFRNRKVIVLPCGLTLGSHITVVGKPRAAHVEIKPEISPLKEEQYLMVSDFILELQGLKTVEGEDPPRILHLNPRLKGDWSGKPVIEHNTCYRMQWGTPQRCEGWRTKADEETVDGFVKCEEWIGDDDNGLEESEATWWLNRLIGRTKKVVFNWPFPFSEEKIFVLTISAGLEGFHVNVNGRHVTSFPYHTGFTLEDATGLSLNGDVDVLSIVAASLPTSHPNYDPQKHLELSDRWRAPPIPDRPIELFIGVLSAGNHFAERMAVRKTWMQHELIKSSNVVARFFVALHRRKEVNEEVKKEAEFFGDIVIVPYMDNYDLVVLKTVAIVEYGVRTVLADYIMKGDDDTFIRVDGILDEAKKVQDNRSLYIGNMNFYHQPMRTGKWAVTYEEWPEEVYPPYANGPGYIISSGIAKFILSDFEKHKLQLFKMEDVSMGMWVEKINKTRPVSYVHSLRFCQFGCIEDYITAHYQSPRQMICLWNKLRRQIRPLCCNMR